MTRFEVLVVIALLLVTLAGLGLRWLWRHWGLRQLTLINKAMMVGVFLGCLLALSLAGAAFWGLWLERPKPVTTDDLRILEKADALLKDESGWNRNDDRRVMTTGPQASLVSSARWRQPVPKCWGSTIIGGPRYRKSGLSSRRQPSKGGSSIG